MNSFVCELKNVLISAENITINLSLYSFLCDSTTKLYLIIQLLVSLLIDKLATSEINKFNHFCIYLMASDHQENLHERLIPSTHFETSRESNTDHHKRDERDDHEKHTSQGARGQSIYVGNAHGHGAGQAHGAEQAHGGHGHGNRGQSLYVGHGGGHGPSFHGGHGPSFHGGHGHHGHGHGHGHAKGHGHGHGVSFHHVENDRHTIHYRQTVAHQTRIKLFPVFGDPNLTQVSLNYYLYFEFYHSILRIFWSCIPFALAIYIYWAFLRDPRSYREVSILFLQFRLFFFYELDPTLGGTVHPGNSDSHAIKLAVADTTGYETADPSGVQTFSLVLVALATNFLFVFFWTREKTRIISNEHLYTNQWSEDLFSVLVRGLPISSTKQSVREHFNDLLEAAGKGGSVQDVILIQDVKELYYVNQEIEKAEDTPGQEELLEKLLEKKARLEGVFNEGRDFKGAAVVIFDTISSRNRIYNHFSAKLYEKVLALFKPETLKRCFFEGQRLIVLEVPEPSTMQFQNVYSSKHQKLKDVIARIIGFGIFLLGLFLIFKIENKEEGAVHHGGFFETVAADMPIAITVAILDYVITKLYMYVQRFMTPINHITPEKRLLTFGALLAICVIGLLQIRPLVLTARHGTPVAALSAEFTVIIVVLCIKAILIKSRQHHAEFEFIEGVTVVYPVIILGLCFFSISPIIILPTVMITLYLSAIMDKRAVMKSKELPHATSIRLVARVFRTLRVIPFFIWMSNTLIGIKMMMRFKEALEATHPTEVQADIMSGINFAVFGGIIVVNVIFLWPGSIENHIMEKFFDKNANVAYTDIQEHFTATYEEAHPSPQMLVDKL